MENTVISPVNIETRKKADIRPGDTVRIWQKITEKGKTRLQAFEGLVIARKHGTEAGATFTVRRVASGVGTEKIFPLYSPMIDKIEVVKRTKVRRAKLYYVKEKAAREIRKRMRQLRSFEGEVIGGEEQKTEETDSNEEEEKVESEKEEINAASADEAQDEKTREGEDTEIRGEEKK